MAIREIVYTISENAISPRTIKKAGIQNEHKPCVLKFVFDSNLSNKLKELENLKYRIDAYDGSGGYHPSEPLEFSLDSNILYHLEQNVTSAGGIAKVYLVISKGDGFGKPDLILYSHPAMLEFENLPYGTQGEKKAVEDINSAVFSAKNSADAANTAKEEILKIKSEVEELQESTEADANEVNEFKDEIRDIRNKYLAGELKGEKGDKGDTGSKGEKGDKGDKGDSYVLTEEDMYAIAEKIKDDTPSYLVYEIVDGEVAITGYKGDVPSDVVIPEIISGYPVTSIRGFGNCTIINSTTGVHSLTTIAIPKSVASVEAYAFYNCKNLSDVYYSGSESDKEKLNIGTGNSDLKAATWHYNYDFRDVYEMLGDIETALDNIIEIQTSLIGGDSV